MGPAAPSATRSPAPAARRRSPNPVTDMRRGTLLLPLALAVLLPSVLAAQTRERVKVTGVRLGLPVGPFTSDSTRRGIFKTGQSAPVYVDLECTQDTEEPLQLIAAAKDA